MTEQWEEIEVPRGAYISWGTKVGQHVTGKVMDYNEAGGTDFNDNPCPQLQIELTEKAASFNKAGDRTDFDAGEFVVLNCGQVSLKRAVRAAALNTGDLVKIELVNLAPSQRGEVKEFAIKVARGAGKTTAPVSAASAEAEPPFNQGF